MTVAPLESGLLLEVTMQTGRSAHPAGVKKAEISRTSWEISAYVSGEDEIRTRGMIKTIRRFSKPVLSATQPPLRAARYAHNHTGCRR